VAERLDLFDRRVRLARLRAKQRVEDHSELTRVAHVVEAEARVDQDQPVAALDEQAVADDPRVAQRAALAADQPPAVRAHRAAGEVMHGVRVTHLAEPTLHGSYSNVTS
jgi:hypothetical protein